MVLVLAGPAHAQTPIELNTWTSESYPAVSGFNAGVWTVAGDKLSVFQSVNGQPTLFYSDFLAYNTIVEGRVKVETTGDWDNDYIGFALGFQPRDASSANADYLLIDWKQEDQSFDFGSPSCTPGGFAPEGLAVSRVSGIPTADEFWGHRHFNSPACSNNKNGLKELQRTSRPGLLALYNTAGITAGSISTETISFSIAPRLNAAGRLEHAFTSYKLLLTTSHQEARMLAERLEVINRERQHLTEEARTLATEQVMSQPSIPPLRGTGL